MTQNWNFDMAWSEFNKPLPDLIYCAQNAIRKHFPSNGMQTSTLLSIKTGKCPEDCSYCPQSAHYNTGLKKEKLMCIEDVVAAAKAAKQNGSSRFCMGAAWRGPHDRDLNKVKEMVSAVKELGLETCATLGILKDGQAEELAAAGLDYYNHNIDTSPEHYEKIITTRTFEQRIDTLKKYANLV